MSRTGARVTIDLIRKALLVALVAVILGVIGLYVVGRMRRPGDAPRANRLEQEERGELVLSGQGFEYGLSKGDREIFRIKAEKLVSDKQKNYELAGVDLQMEHEDGSQYFLTSDTAVYNLDSQAATFTGNVVFRGPNQVELTADGLELVEEGRLLISSSPVEFLFLERFQGRANRMRINPGKNLFVLAGKVEVDTLPGDASPTSLRCRRFSFHRDEHLLRADGDAILTRRDDVLSARRISVVLTEDEKQVEFILARWDVRGRFAQDTEEGETSAVRLTGHEMSIQFEIGTEDPKAAEITGSRRRRASLGVTDPSGLTQGILADRLVGDFELGSLRRAQAFEQVEISEYLAFAPATAFRTACADEADARISPAGELERVDLLGAVMLNDRGVAGFGDEAHADMVAEKMELLGNPSLLLKDRDQLEAPRILFDQATEEIDAEDGVRAVLASGKEINLGTDAAARDEPVTIEGERAEWEGTPPVVTFYGQVRAWQGENFLTADELAGEPETSRVTASGRVRTVWRPEPDQTEEEVSLASDPLEVTAESMEFDRESNTLTYTGAVRAVQLQRSLRCNEMRLFLEEDGGFDQMVCEGSVDFQDGATGDSLRGGEVAVYRPKEQQVEVEGSPVILRDGEGRQFQGKTVVYDFATGRAQMKSAPIEPPLTDDTDP